MDYQLDKRLCKWKFPAHSKLEYDENKVDDMDFATYIRQQILHDLGRFLFLFRINRFRNKYLSKYQYCNSNPNEVKNPNVVHRGVAAIVSVLDRKSSMPPEVMCAFFAMSVAKTNAIYHAMLEIPKIHRHTMDDRAKAAYLALQKKAEQNQDATEYLTALGVKNKEGIFWEFQGKYAYDIANTKDKKELVVIKTAKKVLLIHPFEK